MSRQVAIVTGCSEGGIGFFFCESLVKRDYIVYATARTIESMNRLQHPDVRKLILDVTNDEQAVSVVQTAIKAEGHIDLLINNAGILAPGPIIDYTVDDMKAVYETNVFSIHRLCRLVIPHMAERKQGTIVNMGSIVGEFPTPWTGIYDSSKAAVRILTEDLSLECRPFNIHVMLVAPCVVESRIVGKHDDYQLPPGSLYGGFFHNIRQRLEAARGSGATPTDVFAEEIIEKATRKGARPNYILAGGKKEMFKVMGWLPRQWALNLTWNMFSKPEDKKSASVQHENPTHKTP